MRSNGNGNQSYLHEISKALFEVLMGLSGNQHTFAFSDGFEAAQNALEIEWAASIITDDTERETKATSIVASRKGQGLFKSRIMLVEQGCRVTGAKGHKYLIASHIKPWVKSSNIEKLDGYNGYYSHPISIVYSIKVSYHFLMTAIFLLVSIAMRI